MAKPRKKYNPLKSELYSLEKTLHGLVISYAFFSDRDPVILDNGTEVKPVMVINPVNGKYVIFRKETAIAAKRAALLWSVMLVVYSLESNGKQKTDIEWIQFPARYTQNDLTDILNKHHQSMCSHVKGTLVNMLWFAMPWHVPANEEWLTNFEQKLLSYVDSPAYWDTEEKRQLYDMSQYVKPI